jgi:hypothetical protein
MAYMSQDKKAVIQTKLKPILTKYGIKGTLSVRHHSTLVLTIKSGKIDFVTNANQVNCDKPNFRPVTSGNIDVNTYWYHEHFDGIAKACLGDIIDAMNSGNHDNSDVQTDYFDVGWYIDVDIGSWNKPYTVI